ncbi:hypothetical protein [Citricoccus sp. K5]|uniref:AtuA-related protein n=1 Tax=Citricoccus sp. K5 TaxID=2653135 RepID=UPI0012F2734B|nr:hypothetical protein [Citricoccus sp. K5]VXB67817.1 Beta-lactamase [Citricoccus sp. K5]
MMILDDLATVRAGDKGDALILAVFPRDEEAYAVLREEATEERVAAHFQCSPGQVRRLEQTVLRAFVFRLAGVLGGGVTGSATLDGHGKTLSYHLATLPLPPSRPR